MTSPQLPIALRMIYLFKRLKSFPIINCQFSVFNCLLAYAFFLISSCNSDDEATAPKPKGYFRIDFPKKSYIPYKSDCPFTFDYPVYASVVIDNRKGAEPCWLDINYPNYKSTLHLSYKQVKNNLGKFIEDSRTLATKHEIKASAIDEQIIVRNSDKVYGLLYNIEGNTASSLQFYLTDSTRHFLRGALYFNAVPNSDSIAPVLDFIRKDVNRMVQSFKWN